MATLHKRARSIHARFAITMLGAMTLTVGQLLAAPASADAATFIVGSCSYSTIIAFMEAANDESSYPGGDTIHLKAGCTYILSPGYGTSSFAFPTVQTDMIIVGHGARIELALDDRLVVLDDRLVVVGCEAEAAVVAGLLRCGHWSVPFPAWASSGLPMPGPYEVHLDRSSVIRPTPPRTCDRFVVRARRWD